MAFVLESNLFRIDVPFLNTYARRRTRLNIRYVHFLQFSRVNRGWFCDRGHRLVIFLQELPEAILPTGTNSPPSFFLFFCSFFFPFSSDKYREIAP